MAMYLPYVMPAARAAALMSAILDFLFSLACLVATPLLISAFLFFHTGDGMFPSIQACFSAVNKMCRRILRMLTYGSFLQLLFLRFCSLKFYISILVAQRLVFDISDGYGNTLDFFI